MHSKPKTYNRRGWWPDGWSVVKCGKVWNIKNVDTGVFVAGTFKTETEALIEADCLASERNKRDAV